MPSAPAAGGAFPATPVYLHVKRSRYATGESDAKEDADAPPLVRLRWDPQEMGPLPFTPAGTAPEVEPPWPEGALAGEGARAAPAAVASSIVLRRLTAVSPGGGRGADPHQGSPKRQRGTELRVLGVTRLRDGVVVVASEESEVAEEGSEGCRRSPRAPDAAGAVTEVYVAVADHAEASGSAHATVGVAEAPVPGESACAIAEEFRFDELMVDSDGDGLARDEDGAAALEAIRGLVRRRPRVPSLDGHSSDGEAVGAQLPTYRLRSAKRPRLGCSPQSEPSAWGEVVERHEVCLTDWLREVMPLVALTEEAARAEARAELYCYPDHRHDDEYDSNAEDFSGNDYPDENDDESSGRDDSNGTARRSGWAGYDDEEGYREPSLGSGWGTEDEADGGW